MREGVLAASTALLAAYTPAAAEITRIVGTFSGPITSGFHADQELGTSNDIRGEFAKLDVYYDVGYSGGYGFGWAVSVTNNGSIDALSYGDLSSSSVLTDDSLTLFFSGQISGYNFFGGGLFKADRNGSQLPNWRGRVTYGLNYADISFLVDAQIDDVTFVGEIDGFTTSVPEPATWGMMIAGFGLAGAAVRRGPRYAMSRSLQRC
jgi:hypothetical protein